MSSFKNADNKLPDGWVLCQSKSIPGRKYYFNKKTGKSSWSQPQEDDKSDKKNSKKEKHRRLEKRKREEQSKKGTKRKSDSHEDNASKKRTKQDISGSLANTSKRASTSQSEQKRNESPKHTSTPKTTPSKSFNKNETPMKQSPVKNLANTRLSQLRALLNSEAKEEEDPDLPKKPKISPKFNESHKRNDNSPSFNDSKSTQSPSSDSLQSIPSPSQFFAANKIISSMKAQLPEEYCSKEKQKDTFADIEKGICSQTTEYPYSKHPATPPQFSEASKLMSAIKSKLAYKGSTSKEVKQFSSAKERMENLRMSLSLETDKELNSSCSFLCESEKSCEVDTEDTKNMSEAMEVEDFREIKPKSPPIQRDNIGEGENLVLVVDTNIFIYDLHFIKHVLNSHIRGYSEPPTLLIPWRVINELDRLKDNNNGNGVLCKRAKAAMDYLYKSLPENNRIKGQSLRDANSHIYPCEVPDDEILNCSLQQVERGKNVILVSNDKNLCTKATINGVKRIDVHELKKLIEIKPQASNPDLLTNVKCYQQNMYRLLANILENEMRAKYNNLWEHVLFKAPPWSLMDVIKCLLKHWMAVFSEVFPRIESIIVDFKNSLLILDNKDAKTLTPSEVTNFKELCLDIARKCQIIPEYMDLAKITVEKLLKNSGEELSLEQNHESISNESQGRLHDESQVKLNDESQVGKEVVESFEGMWTVLSSYCAKLSTGLGIEHTIDDKLPGNEPLTTLTSKWDEYSRHVNDLICAIDGVLNTEDSSPHIQRLENVLKDVSGVVSTTQLTSFCLNCRNMLQEAHSKFSQLSELLNLCRSRFSIDSN